MVKDGNWVRLILLLKKGGRGVGYRNIAPRLFPVKTLLGYKLGLLALTLMR